MPTRPFSAETLTGTIQDTDISPLSRDPLGTPLSRVATALTWKNYFLAGVDGAPLVPVTAADVGAYTLPNGGSVVAATVTDDPGAPTGNVDDFLEISVTNPTIGVGPCMVAFPITLAAGIPASAKMRVSTLYASAPHDIRLGFMFVSDAATSLALTRNVYLTPPADYTIDLAEFDPGSGSPAAWETQPLPYAPGELMEVSLRTVMPFTAVPQLEFDIRTLVFDTAGTQNRTFFVPANVASGTLNDSGDWTGATLTELWILVMFPTSYVGTATYQIQLAKNF
jgi:hypothetical protein